MQQMDVQICSAAISSCFAIYFNKTSLVQKPVSQKHLLPDQKESVILIRRRFINFHAKYISHDILYSLYYCRPSNYH